MSNSRDPRHQVGAAGIGAYGDTWTCALYSRIAGLHFGDLRAVKPVWRRTMKRFKGIHRIAIGAVVFLVPMLAAGAFQSPYDFEHGAIAYTTSVASDAIARLQARIDSGQTSLRFDPEYGYLPA